jgi:uncharacterized protein with gpF-like domain
MLRTLLAAAHDRAFVVAGATKADLLADLAQAVDKAINTGATLEMFRQNFRKIIAPARREKRRRLAKK